MSQELSPELTSNQAKEYPLNSQIATLKSYLGVEAINTDGIKDGIILLSIKDPNNNNETISLEAAFDKNGKGRVTYGQCYAVVDLATPTSIRESINILAKSEFITLEQFKSRIKEEIINTIPDLEKERLIFGEDNNIMSAYFEDDNGYEIDIFYTMYTSSPRVTMTIAKRSEDDQDFLEEFSGEDLTSVISYL